MHIYLDAERNEIQIGHHVAVWDNWYKGMYRCEVIGFTPQRVRLKSIGKSKDIITLLKHPIDLLIIKK